MKVSFTMSYLMEVSFSHKELFDDSNPNYVDLSNLPPNKYKGGNEMVEQYENQQYHKPIDHTK